MGRLYRVTPAYITPVQADPNLLLLIIDNLLRNAIKFTREVESPRIEIRTTHALDGSRICWVRDNGIGLDTNSAEQIFAPFHRLHSKTVYEGSGLGLSIVKRAVERHGGNVWAESREGNGATFFFTLPQRD